MTIVFGLNLFNWRIGTFDIRLELEQGAVAVPVVDRSVKGVSRWWVRHMAK